ncbi:MAG: hypothetical protein GY870_04335 [archaeon]|nr:hypothetical protein [archaeon]
MNIIKQIFIIFFLTVVSMQLVNGQNHNTNYDFPIKPGTDAWKSLNSSQEMIDICQIPDSILKIMTTANLSSLCLNYPLLGDMLFNDNFQEGFDMMASKFNGFQELFLRKDAGSELLKLYKDFNLNSFEKNKDKKNNNIFFDMCIDVVLAQQVFLKNLDTEQEIMLMQDALNNLKIREKNNNSSYRKKSTVVILSRLLIKKDEINRNKSTFKSDNFLLLNNYFILVDASFIDIIKQEAECFLKN